MTDPNRQRQAAVLQGALYTGMGVAPRKDVPTEWVEERFQYEPRDISAGENFFASLYNGSVVSFSKGVAQLAPILGQAVLNPKEGTKLDDFFDTWLNTTNQLFEGAKAQVSTVPSFFEDPSAKAMAQGLGQGLGFMLTLAVGGGMSGATTKLVQYAVGTGIGTTYMMPQLRQEAIDAGIDKVSASRFAAAAAPILALSEYIGFRGLGKIIDAPAVNALRREAVSKATKQFVEQGANRKAFYGAAQTMQDVMITGLKDKAKVAGVKAASGLLLEGAQEFGQSYIQEGIEQIYDSFFSKGVDAQFGANVLGKEQLKGALEEAMYGGIIGFLMGGGGGAIYNPATQESMYGYIESATDKKKALEKLKGDMDYLVKSKRMTPQEVEYGTKLLEDIVTFTEQNISPDITNKVARFQAFQMSDMKKELLSKVGGDEALTPDYIAEQVAILDRGMKEIANTNKPIDMGVVDGLLSQIEDKYKNPPVAETEVETEVDVDMGDGVDAETEVLETDIDGLLDGEQSTTKLETEQTREDEQDKTDQTKAEAKQAEEELLISLIDEIDTEVANLSKKRGEKAKKDLEKQLERKARAEKDLEDVRRELAGLRGEGVDGTETGVGEEIGTSEEGVAQEGVEGDVKVEPDTDGTVVKVEPDKTDALKDVESTAKALEGVDTSNIELTRENFYIVSQEIYEKEVITWDDMQKLPPELKIKQQKDFEVWVKKNKNRLLSEAYHKAKADGSNPELVAAVEELLGTNASQQQGNDKTDALKDVESTAKALEDVVKVNPEIFKKLTSDIRTEVVDDNKKVETVYHGTNNVFDIFDLDKVGDNTGAKSTALGVFFTDNPNVSKNFTDPKKPIIKKATLQLKNPFVIGFDKLSDRKKSRSDPFISMEDAIVKFSKKEKWSDVTKDDVIAWKNKVQELGYDGIIVKRTAMDGLGGYTARSIDNPYHNFYIVFDNKNIIQHDSKSIAEAYHKAKADGSNPELVKAVEQSLKETKAGSVVGGDNKSEFTDVGYVAARKKADGILENKKEATPIVGIRNAGSGSGVFVPFRMVKDEWIDSETTKREEGETFIYDDVNDKYYNVKDFSKSELDFLTDRDNFSEQSLKETNVTQQEGKDKADVGGTKGKGSQKVPQNGTDSKKSPSEKVEQPPQVRPQKQVKANQKIATEEVAEARGEDVGDMNVLYSNQFRNLPVIDDTDTDAMLTYEAEGMPNGLEKDSVPPQIRKRVNGLLDKGYLYYDGGMFYLTPKGAEIVDAIDARLETRQRVKGGTDLFPNEAKIGENTLGSAIASAKALDQAFKAGIDLSESVEDNIQEMEDKGIIEKDCN
jgi:hypothetical protein